MDKQHFEQLIKGVRGSRTKELTEPDIRAIRETAKISQTQFAKLIGVNVRTLQNWEQNRTSTAGPRSTEDSGVLSEGCGRSLHE